MRRPAVDGGGEWVPSLALFTTLLPAAVGAYAWWVFYPLPPVYRWIAPLLAVIGLIGATGHLGHLLPGPLVLTRLKSSWLAREVVAAGLFTALAAADAAILPFLKWSVAARIAFRLVTLAIGVLGGVASVQLYRVETHPSWRSPYHFWWALAATISMGSSFAVIFQPGITVRLWLGIGLALDLFSFFVYCLWMNEAGNGAEESFRALMYHLPLAVLRILLPVAGFSLARVIRPMTPLDTRLLPALYFLVTHLIHRMLFYRTGVKKPAVNLPYYTRMEPPQ